MKDADGVSWEVSEHRGTRHGFDVLLGWRVGGRKGRAAGRSQVILTQALVRYLERHRMSPGRMTLPIGLSAITRLRERLGHHILKDRRRWWTDRGDDLARLTGNAFAAKHGRTPSGARYVGRALFGTRHHRKGWWRSPEVCAVLLSGKPDVEIAAALGLARSSVRRLRMQLRRKGLASAP